MYTYRKIVTSSAIECEFSGLVISLFQSQSNVCQSIRTINWLVLLNLKCSVVHLHEVLISDFRLKVRNYLGRDRNIYS